MSKQDILTLILAVINIISLVLMLYCTKWSGKQGSVDWEWVAIGFSWLQIITLVTAWVAL